MKTKFVKAKLLTKDEWMALDIDKPNINKVMETFEKIEIKDENDLPKENQTYYWFHSRKSNYIWWICYSKKIKKDYLRESDWYLRPISESRDNICLVCGMEMDLQSEPKYLCMNPDCENYIKDNISNTLPADKTDDHCKTCIGPDCEGCQYLKPPIGNKTDVEKLKDCKKCKHDGTDICVYDCGELFDKFELKDEIINTNKTDVPRMNKVTIFDAENFIEKHGRGDETNSVIEINRYGIARFMVGFANEILSSLSASTVRLTKDEIKKLIPYPNPVSQHQTDQNIGYIKGYRRALQHSKQPEVNDEEISTLVNEIAYKQHREEQSDDFLEKVYIVREWLKNNQIPLKIK